jgi:Uma2 family endonuclease
VWGWLFTFAEENEMAHVDQAQATLDDLYREPGKAELIGGRIVHLMPTGRRPNRIAGRIFRSLDEHADKIGRGEAYTDNMGFTVAVLPSGRQSFSPDASYYAGPFSPNPMRFIDGAPTFGAEVRSENDYTDAAEAEIAEKRADYFAAGTLVVWDVDVLAERIHCYRSADPNNPTTFLRNQWADAEPAVPGWRVSVNWIFS